MSEYSVPVHGDQLLDRLLDLEAAKTEALLHFDADAYETAVAVQDGLLSDGVLDQSALSRDRVMALADKTRLNLALLLNLVSVSPYFAMMQQGYTADGGSPDATAPSALARG